MTIISEHKLKTLYCVAFTFDKKRYFSYFQTIDQAQRSAHKYLLAEDFSNIEFSVVKVIDSDELKD